jgi:hypothetical protein
MLRSHSLRDHCTENSCAIIECLLLVVTSRLDGCVSDMVADVP